MNRHPCKPINVNNEYNSTRTQNTYVCIHVRKLSFHSQQHRRFLRLLALTLLDLLLTPQRALLLRLPGQTTRAGTRADRESPFEVSQDSSTHPTTSSVPALTTRLRMDFEPRTPPMLTTHWKASKKRKAACRSKDFGLRVFTGRGRGIGGGDRTKMKAGFSGSGGAMQKSCGSRTSRSKVPSQVRISRVRGEVDVRLSCRALQETSMTSTSVRV